MSKVYVYVDGSYSDSRLGGGIVIVNSSNDTILFERGVDLASIVSDEVEKSSLAAELLTVLVALKLVVALNYKHIVISYDNSMIYNLIAGLTKAKDSYIMDYYIKTFNELAKELESVEFNKVKAHSSNRFLNRADKLAKRGIIW